MQTTSYNLLRGYSTNTNAFLSNGKKLRNRILNHEFSLVYLTASRRKDNVPTPGIPTDGDINESAADENSVVCLVGAGIVDRNRNGPCTPYNTEDKCIIIGIINTVNPE